MDQPRGTSPLVKCWKCGDWLPLTAAVGPRGHRSLMCECGASVLPPVMHDRRIA